MAVSNPIVFEVEITGKVDDMREEIFAQQNDPVADWPTAKTNAVDIAKAGIRYKAMLDQISLLANFNLTDVVRTGRTKDSPATAIAFNLTFYRDRPSYLKTEDEENPGTFLYGADAIVRAIARAISVDYVQNYSYWDPTVTVTRTNTNTTSETTPPRGWAYDAITAEKLYADIATAEAAITVTQV